MKFPVISRNQNLWFLLNVTCSAHDLVRYLIFTRAYIDSVYEPDVNGELQKKKKALSIKYLGLMTGAQN